MKIIFISTKSITFNTFLRSQADYLSKKGFKIQVACSDVEKLNYPKDSRYKINFPQEYFHLLNLYKYVKVFFQIKELIKNNKSSIFYLHTPVASHFFRFFSFFNNLKILYFVHGFRFTNKDSSIKTFFFKIIEKFLSINTKVFITINHEDFNYAKNFFSNQARAYKLNGVGVDIPKKIQFRPKNKIKKIIVIAVYKKSKGYIDLINIAELLKDYNIKIDCYGYGDDEKFKHIIIKKKIKNISFKKFDPNLKNKIKNYDLLLHLSKREGLPVSVIECLSRGLPFIGYKIRGNEDLIINEYNGIFVESYKSVSNVIFYLNLNNTFYNKMRLNAVNSINKSFSKNNINQSIYKIILKNFKKN